MIENRNKKRVDCFGRASLAMTIPMILLLLLLTACGGKGFEQREVLPEAKWEVEHRIPFDVTVNDTLGIYAFGLSLRHLENYRYSNLYVFLHTTMPNGNLTHDTIQC